MDRRRFLKGGAGLALLWPRAAPSRAAAKPTAGTTVLVPRGVRPVVVASANGNRFKNGGPRTCVEEAFQRLAAGSDVLDAVIAGVNILENDPDDTSVGYGWLPNADGVVQLDASCMHGPRRQAGAVACLEGVRTPSSVARVVMAQTDHHLLVGEGAREFARRLGFKIEEDLNTETSRRLWLEWKRRIDPQHYLDPSKRSAAWERATRSMLAEGLLDRRDYQGTVNCNALGPRGEIAGVTTTSGLAFKIPGRAGNSPIFGAGLYVDGEAGAAGSTGRGEANLFGLSSFLIVEGLRKGMPPKDAGMEALRRIVANTTEKRLLNRRGKPDFYVSFYILDRQGNHAGVSLYSVFGGRPMEYAVCDENGPRTLPCEGLLGEAPKE
jgi:N4-(beta-N-acetylglucosaminyl)-L-asparaginase